MAIDCLSGLMVWILRGRWCLLFRWKGENALHLYPDFAN